LWRVEMFFNMPQALRDAGGEVFVTDVDFAPNVVIDRELITGQNPRSDHPIAQALVAALDRATA
jgi:putative intracellular protease/amidase